MALGGDGRGGPRVKIKWPVTVTTAEGSMDGVTLDLGPDGAFVSCAKPARLNEVIDIIINAPDQPIEARAEVIWSNKYGPDDEINPRGMGVRFLNISEEDRQFIAKIVNEHSEPETRSGAMETVTLKVEEN